ncbi:MAG: glycoside hydrolase family 3 C-terminal domain-containing protein [Candidatus Bipolaricaulota bacterium]|nr:glycoside hydrolase family 3 C-terminal domain-containing protein [Candidatus Bipolaricaulota bacterium]MDW8151696.1 glycoside hydrolase family 3 N-terminal domain-containing protein [Candidatus Bipolaricaulota bacterium]
MLKKILFGVLVVFGLYAVNGLGSVKQPEIEARVVPILEIGGFKFKDLNKNGVLDPYEDWRLSVDERVENLLAQMTLEEKIGQLLHPNLGAPHTLEWVKANAKRWILDVGLGCILTNAVSPPQMFATWTNAMQEVAESSRLGIPIIFSSDPRHGALLIGHVTGTQYFSAWPKREGMLGIAATRNLELAKRFGEVMAIEYRAVGLHMFLGPIVDVMTEPRWGRNGETFGEDAELTAAMAAAFIKGAQGETLGPNSIVTMPKHWPGSGPHAGGAGRWFAYPGNNFEYHLKPFIAAFKAGAPATMCYYSGIPFADKCAVCYSKYLDHLLRVELGFSDIIMCTDWGVISRVGPLREDLAALDIKGRYLLALEAGVDMFGGERDPEPLIALVKEGKVSEERINQSVRKILRLKFQLGLFEDPYVDPIRAQAIVGSAEFKALGYQAQLESVVLLKNDGILPLPEAVLEISPNKVVARRPKVYAPSSILTVTRFGVTISYLMGVDPAVLSQYATVVDNPNEADFAIIEIDVGGIEIPPERLKPIDVARSAGIPIILVLNFDRAPTVVKPELVKSVNALIATFDIQDNALLDVIFGRFKPVGKLPFQIPSSMESVLAQKEDVPFDLENPMFDYGFGLSY